MCAMTLRLDPRRPIVWRTPHSLQIGVDPVLAQLDDVSDGHVRLIDALSVGVTRSGLAMLAEQAGVPAPHVDELLAGLDAALLSPVTADVRAPSALTSKSVLPTKPEKSMAARPAPRATIAVVGSGIGATRVAAVLSEAGLAATLVRPGLTESTALVRGRRATAAVLVSAHVIDPREHCRWLRSDVPHVPVVFGEAAVTVGPLVEVGTTACLACVEQRRTRDDPARPAIASQLWGTAAAAESAGLATEAAVEALRMLRARILTSRNNADGDADADAIARAAVSVRLDAATGDRVEREWWPNEQCGCGGLSPLSEPALRRESDWGPALLALWSPVATRSARAPFVPA